MNIRDALREQGSSLALQRAAADEIARLDARQRSSSQIAELCLVLASKIGGRAPYTEREICEVLQLAADALAHNPKQSAG